MRLFIALHFSPPVMDMLKGVITQLAKQGRGNLTRPENLHLTCVFIGETTDAAGAAAALREASDCPPFEITVGGSGHFGNLYWVGIDKSHELEKIAASLRNALKTHGLPFDEKAFKPHITVARQFESVALPKIEAPSVSMQVEGLSLMRSDRVDGKLTYTEIAYSRLTGRKQT
jgi:2'-5' RNA ligase